MGRYSLRSSTSSNQRQLVSYNDKNAFSSEEEEEEEEDERDEDYTYQPEDSYDDDDGYNHSRNRRKSGKRNIRNSGYDLWRRHVENDADVEDDDDDEDFGHGESFRNGRRAAPQCRQYNKDEYAYNHSYPNGYNVPPHPQQQMMNYNPPYYPHHTHTPYPERYPEPPPPPPTPKTSFLRTLFKFTFILILLCSLITPQYIPPPPHPYTTWKQPLYELTIQGFVYVKKVAEVGFYVTFGAMRNLYADVSILLEDQQQQYDEEVDGDRGLMEDIMHDEKGNKDKGIMEDMMHDLLEIKPKETQNTKKSKEIQNTKKSNKARVKQLQRETITNKKHEINTNENIKVENDTTESNSVISKIRQSYQYMTHYFSSSTQAEEKKDDITNPSSSSSSSTSCTLSLPQEPIQYNPNQHSLFLYPTTYNSPFDTTSFLQHNLLSQDLAIQQLTTSLSFLTEKKQNIGMIFTGFEGTGKYRMGRLITHLLLYNCKSEVVVATNYCENVEYSCPVVAEEALVQENLEKEVLLVLDGNEYYYDEDEEGEDDKTTSTYHDLKQDLVHYLLKRHQQQQSNNIYGSVIILRHIEWMPPSIIAELVAAIHEDGELLYKTCPDDNVDNIDDETVDVACTTQKVTMENTIVIFTTQYGTKSLFEHLRRRTQENDNDDDMTKAMEQDIRNEIDLNFVKTGVQIGKLIDAIIPFQPLDPTSMKEILRHNVHRLSNQYSGKQWNYLLVSEAALDYLSGTNYVEYWTIRDPDSRDVVMTLSKHGAHDLADDDNDDSSIDDDDHGVDADDNDDISGGLIMKALKTKVMGGLRERPDRIALIDFSTEAGQFMIRWCKSNDDGKETSILDDQERLCDDAYWFDFDV